MVVDWADPTLSTTAVTSPWTTTVLKVLIGGRRRRRIGTGEFAALSAQNRRSRPGAGRGGLCGVRHVQDAGAWTVVV